MSKVKNQHYVPQFYLRYFSIDSKNIGVYRPDKDHFIPSAPIRHQASKSLIYGADGIIESAFSNLEGLVSLEINKILKDPFKFKTLAAENEVLSSFIISSFLRTKKHFDNTIKLFENVDSILKAKGKQIELNLKHSMSHEEIVRMSIRNIHRIYDFAKDLHVKLILNEGNTPFISSDHPTVLYNKLFDIKKSNFCTNGFSVEGIKIFFPLTPKFCLLLYDPNVYRVGNKKDKVIKIIIQKDVDQLNLLQLNNCQNCTFFNQGISNEYLKRLLSQCNIRNRWISSDIHESGIVNQGGALYMSWGTNLKTNLDLSFLRLTKKVDLYVVK